MIMNSIQLWFEAARPKTLFAAFAPFLMGCAMAYADGGFHLLSALYALFAAVLIQVGTNLSNDYYDFQKGTDDESRIGPRRVTQSGLISPSLVKRAFLIVFGLAFLFGFLLALRSGWPILLLGAVCILCGLWYTAGSYSLAYLGLGDIFVLIFFGPVATAGTYYVQTLTFDWTPVVMGLAPGLLSMAILTANNLRDVVGDKVSNKKTLVVRFGRRFGQAEYILTVFLSCALPFFIFFQQKKSVWVLLPALVFIPFLSCFKTVLTETGSVLNRILAKTGALLFLYALLFSVGWLL